MADKPSTVAWISDFPVEWLSDAPEALARLPRGHPLTWQRVLLEELEKSTAFDLQILVVRKDVQASTTFSRRGVNFHVIKAPPRLRAPSLFWIDTLLIKRVFKKIRPHLIHAWGTERGAGLVATRLGKPFLLTMQGLLEWYGEIIPLQAYERFTAAIEKYTLRRTGQLTTESTFAVNYLQNRYPSLSVHQVEHAPNWMFHSLHRHPQQNPLRFLYVGTLEYRKGTDLLLRAFDTIREEFSFELILVGGDQNTPFIQSLKPTLSKQIWERITFKGALSADQIMNELALTTMLVFPTRADTSPNAVKEAVVAGVPVVASDVGGIPDYVFPNQNGLIFPSGNLDLLVLAIKKACHHPLFRRGEVETKTLAQTRDYLSPKLMGEKFSHLYTQLCAPSGQRQTARE